MIQLNTVHLAMEFASEAHKKQYRKGTDRPYIIHPMEVLQLLTEMQASEELKVAGVLHDTVEDTDMTIEDIEENFGELVASYVSFVTEDKSKTWVERKRNGIEKTKNAPLELKMLKLADKLSNLRSIAHDYNKEKDFVWNRFSKSKIDQKWYYQGMCDALKDLEFNNSTYKLYTEFTTLCYKIFE
ncbi:MAG: HD domain-containing protein [Erysipelotrichaceae bacterium]|jgi:(p)ppGpp synthase/HD superfamily hydrolase